MTKEALQDLRNCASLPFGTANLPSELVIHGFGMPGCKWPKVSNGKRQCWIKGAAGTFDARFLYRGSTRSVSRVRLWLVRQEPAVKQRAGTFPPEPIGQTGRCATQPNNGQT